MQTAGKRMKSQSQKLSKKIRPKIKKLGPSVYEIFHDMRSEIEMPSCTHSSVERVNLNQNQNNSCARFENLFS